MPQDYIIMLLTVCSIFYHWLVTKTLLQHTCKQHDSARIIWHNAVISHGIFVSALPCSTCKCDFRTPLYISATLCLHYDGITVFKLFVYNVYVLCQQRSRIVDAASQPCLPLCIDQQFLQTRTDDGAVPAQNTVQLHIFTFRLSTFMQRYVLHSITSTGHGAQWRARTKWKLEHVQATEARSNALLAELQYQP